MHILWWRKKKTVILGIEDPQIGQSNAISTFKLQFLQLKKKVADLNLYDPSVS